MKRTYQVVIMLFLIAAACFGAVLPRPFDGSAVIMQDFDDIGLDGNQHKAIDYAMPIGRLLRARKTGVVIKVVDNQPNNWDPIKRRPKDGRWTLGNEIIIEYPEGTPEEQAPR